MKNNRHAGAWLVAAVVALVLLVPTSAYVGGYFLLSEKRAAGVGLAVRVYPTRWLAALYRPAARIESRLTSTQIDTWGPARLPPDVGLPLHPYRSQQGDA